MHVRESVEEGTVFDDAGRAYDNAARASAGNDAASIDIDPPPDLHRNILPIKGCHYSHHGFEVGNRARVSGRRAMCAPFDMNTQPLPSRLRVKARGSRV